MEQQKQMTKPEDAIRPYAGPLENRNVAVLTSKLSSSADNIKILLERLGAHVSVIDLEESQSSRDKKSELKYDSVVVDCSRVSKPLDKSKHVQTTFDCTMDALFQSAKLANQLTRNNGRILWFGHDRTDSEIAPENYITRMHNAGIEGIMRSQAKEVGRKGITVNMATLDHNNILEEDLKHVRHTSNTEGTLQLPTSCIGPLSFLVSSPSAYVTGQRIDMKRRPTTDPHKVVRVEDDTSMHTGKVLSNSQRAGTPPPLTGKVAIVTGAAQGIGYATSLDLAKHGVHVVAVDILNNSEKLVQLSTMTGGSHVVGDLRESSSRENIVKFIHENFSQFDLLVHCAGITRDRTIKNMKYDEFTDVINTNLESIKSLDSALLDTKEESESLGASTLMRSNGRIVYMSSINGIAGAFGQSNYAYSKGALIEYARLMGDKLLKQNEGCTANAIAPGYILTDMTKDLPLLTKLFGELLTALSQGGQPSDVASAITMLCLPSSGGINGQTIRVCGGHLQGK